MRRALLVSFVLLVGMAGAVVYTGVARDREYHRLVAAGDQARLDEQGLLAIEAYSGAIALNRSSMLAHLKRGETYRERGDLPASIRDLAMAANLDPSAPRPLDLLGDATYALGQYTAAAGHYRHYVQLDNQNPRVLYKLALAEHQGGGGQRVEQLLRRAVELDPRFSEASYLLGLYLQAEDRHDEARGLLEHAVELSPGMLDAREVLAAVYRALDETRLELQQLEALAALDRDRPDRHVTRGLAYARAGRTDLAVVALGRAAEELQDQPLVYTALGRLWLDIAETSGDHAALSKAIEALESISLSTASSEALTLLGRSLSLNGDLQGARRALQLAVERYPVQPDAFIELAQLEAWDLNDGEAAMLRRRHARLVGEEDVEAEAPVAPGPFPAP